MWVLLVVVHFVIPLVMIRAGWRGKRFDHHPVCRRCGFDLINLFGDVDTCPECGADLHRWRAVMIGNRRHAWTLIAVGVMMLVFFIFAAVLIGAAMYDQNRLASIKPDWLLQREASSSNLKLSGLAISELETRMRSGSLGDARIRELIDTGLDCQSDPACGYHGFWVSFIDAAWEVGAITPEQYGRMFVQGVVFEGGLVVGTGACDRTTPCVRVDDRRIPASLTVHGRALSVNRWSDDRLRLELVKHDDSLRPYTMSTQGWGNVNLESGLFSLHATWDITIMDGDTELITVRETIEHIVHLSELPP